MKVFVIVQGLKRCGSMKNREYFLKTATIDQLMKIAKRICPLWALGDTDYLCKRNYGSDKTESNCNFCIREWLNEEQKVKHK